MSYVEKIKALGQRAAEVRHLLENEESTKKALVLPFIEALGFSTWDPREVAAEFTADVGQKKGEKVDYAIIRNGEVAMLVECKKAGAELSIENASQLYRYFGVTRTRIALLTNGIEYRFYMDLDEPNKMDSRPFLTLNLLDLRDHHLVTLKRLTKEGFDVDTVAATAENMKYAQAISSLFERQLDDPDDELVQFFFRRVSDGRWVQSAREQFTPLVKSALRGVIEERVQARLKQALSTTQSEAHQQVEEEDAAAAEAVSSDGVETTEEELEGFRIVRAIVCDTVAPDRVTYRDAKSYFAVLVDDNNRQPICRLHFNRSQKYVGIFDADKNETRHPIDGPEGLYAFATELRVGAARWVGE